ncbi:MAG: hypothetical protein ACYS0H_11995 [Planctomycetota bacterium]|jgi:hypothetical protein
MINGKDNIFKDYYEKLTGDGLTPEQRPPCGGAEAADRYVGHVEEVMPV